jgi:pilus assembly protein CpaF
LASGRWSLHEDESILDIMVNSPKDVYIERRDAQGRCDERTGGVKFRDDAHLMHIINRIVSLVGRRVDESSPMVDARLPNGSRFNAIIPPLASAGRPSRSASSARAADGGQAAGVPLLSHRDASAF